MRIIASQASFAIDSAWNPIYSHKWTGVLARREDFMYKFWMAFDKLEQMVVAARAVEHDEQARTITSSKVENSPLTGLDAIADELADRILKGFAWRPLGGPYEDIFRALLEVPVGDAVSLEDLARKLGASFDEIKARLAKLSGRMKRIATPAELTRFRTPFMLFADIESNNGSTMYRLTPAGRAAAKRYLAR
jgi:O6-methylguanine-DNA--protein-cysteine methyltransferase